MPLIDSKITIKLGHLSAAEMRSHLTLNARSTVAENSLHVMLFMGIACTTLNVT